MREKNTKRAHVVMVADEAWVMVAAHHLAGSERIDTQGFHLRVIQLFAASSLNRQSSVTEDERAPLQML